MAKMSGIVKNVFFCDLVHSNVKCGIGLPCGYDIDLLLPRDKRYMGVGV